MSIVYERLVAEDLNIGHGSVTVTMPGGGSATGSKVGLHTLTSDTVLNAKDFGARGDGRADDAAAIQAAITAAAGGGAVYLPMGTYRVGQTLSLASGVTLYGAEAPGQTILKLSDTFLAAGEHIIVEAEDVDDVCLRDLTFDGNRTVLVSASSTSFTMSAVRLTHVSGGVVCRCRFQNAIGKGHYLGLIGNGSGGNDRIHISQNYFIEGGSPGTSFPLDHIYIQATQDVHVVDNVLIDWCDTGIGLEHAVSQIVVRGNICRTTVATAVDALVYSGNGDAQDILITENILSSPNSYGIGFREMLAPANTFVMSNVTITNNIVEYGLRGISVKGLTDISNAQFRQINHVVIAGNIVTPSDDAVPTSAGIVVQDYVQDVQIYGNTVAEAQGNGIAVIRIHDTSEARIAIHGNHLVHPGLDDTGDSNSAGIAIFHATTLIGLLVSGNNIRGDGTTMSYGIYISATDMSSCRVEGNNISGMSNSVASINVATVPAASLHGQIIKRASGVTGAIATGATVTHGLEFTPTVVIVSAQDSGPTDIYVTAKGATTFVINYGGGGTHVFAWHAEP